MHITETVDFGVALSINRHKRTEAQAKTLILSAANNRLGPATKTYVIVGGSNCSVAKTSVNLLDDYAEVFALESAADMSSYFQHNGSYSAGFLARCLRAGLAVARRQQ